MLPIPIPSSSPSHKSIRRLECLISITPEFRLPEGGPMAEAEEDSDSHSIAGPRAGLFPGLRRPTRRPRPPLLAAASPRVSPWLLSNAVRGAHGPRSRYIAITLCFLLATACLA